MTKQYEGGYFLHSDPLVRGFGHNGHTALDLSGISKITVQAVNVIQDTAWSVNGFILDLIQGRTDSETNLTNSDGVILRVEAPINPRLFMNELSEADQVDLPYDDPMRSFVKLDPAVWAALSPEDKKDKNAARAEVFEKYESDLGELRATQRIIAVAAEMIHHEKFYFPHNMDFRLRIYPIPTDLSPQANDLSKGLLKFYQGTRLGDEGLFWLGVTVASHWGFDKASMQERYDFVATLKDIQKWVDNPLKHRGWTEADAPFQFLAAAHEWVWANRLSNPEDFISYLPGNLDGSCNGAQHLSIMVRDTVGATATNCRSITERQDLYMRVGDRVYERAMADAARGNDTAAKWVAKLAKPSDRRKVVKRSVMTVPYGVTGYGVAKFMIADKHVKKTEWEDAKYIKELIMNSIDDLLEKGRELQFWFRDCAVLCAKAGLPFVWDTPAGSKVVQAYRNLIEKRIVTMNTRFTVYKEALVDEDGADFARRMGMNEKKSGTSAPPNVVHSCDAAHLQITAVRMYQAGIRNFSMIHDSFGCPMAQVGLMRNILRQAAVDMYADNYLAKFKASVEKYSGLVMPEPPELGDFDITEILESEFFFS